MWEDYSILTGLDTQLLPPEAPSMAFMELDLLDLNLAILGWGDLEVCIHGRGERGEGRHASLARLLHLRAVRAAMAATAIRATRTTGEEIEKATKPVARARSLRAKAAGMSEAGSALLRCSGW